ncbi:hypothetical protein AMK32_27745 [Streptomyces sp. CB01883]|nr:hypothetical protein AMK32_27745 [Streptomyces sp. CB01883]
MEAPPPDGPAVEPLGAGSGLPPVLAPVPAEGVRPEDGVPEGTPLSSDFAGDDGPDPRGAGLRPVTASLTVVPPPPPKRLPDTSSQVLMPAIVTPNTTAAATTGRRQPRTRAR